MSSAIPIQPRPIRSGLITAPHVTAAAGGARLTAKTPGSVSVPPKPGANGNTGVAGGGVGTAKPGGASPAAGGGAVTNTAAPNPEQAEFARVIRERIAQQQAKEGAGDPLLQEQVENLRGRMSADTTGRAIDRASTDIASAETAANKRLTADLARRGIAAGSGIEFAKRGDIASDAVRAKARSASDITMGRERDLDALVLGGQQIMSAPGQRELTREGMTNSLLPLQLQGSNSMAQNQLGQQGLALNQWQAQQQSEIERARLAQQQAAQQQAMQLEAQRLALSQLSAF